MCLLPVRPCECLGNDIRRNLPRGMRPRPGHPDRRLGDFDLAGDAAREAFARRTGGRGILSNPRAWLMTTARNRGTDRLRVPGGVRGANLGHSEIETICRLRSVRRWPRSPRDPALAATKLAYGLVVFDIATGSGVVLCRLPRAGTSTAWCCCSERSNRVILSSAPWEY